MINYQEPKADDYSKIYAVFNGKVDAPTIYRKWANVQEVTHNFPGVVYKSFYSYREAEDYLNNLEEAQNRNPDIRYYSSFTSLELMHEYIERNNGIGIYVDIVNRDGKSDILYMIKKGDRVQKRIISDFPSESYKSTMISTIINLLEKVSDNNPSTIYFITSEPFGLKWALEQNPYQRKDIQMIFRKVKGKGLKFYNYNFNKEKTDIKKFLSKFGNN